MKHIVLMSGGIGSWAAAKRVSEQHGPEDIIMLFTDTKTEDEDTYRFLHDAADNVGGELVIIADGRDIWQVFRDKQFLANSRVDICSRMLKRELADSWIQERFQPDEMVGYVGIDWSEEHRYQRMAARKAPYVYKAPLCEAPWLTKAELHQWATSEGLEKQRLYKIGLPHANCGGGCVKAGVGHWRVLYMKFPERYLEWEENEQKLYRDMPKAKPFLRVMENGEDRYMTLRELRIERLEPERQGAACQIDMFDLGGCGCFTE